MLYSLDDDANQGNTKTTLQSLGPVELKYISYGDTMAFAKILKEKESDKTLTEKLLHRQLISPQCSFKDFQKLPDSDLQILASAFIINENSFFKHPEAAEVAYKDFIEATRESLKKQNEDALATIKPLLENAQGVVANFNLKYASVLGEAAQKASLLGIGATLKHIKYINHINFNSQQSLIQSAIPVANHYGELASRILKSLEPQIDIWTKWANQNQQIWSNFQAIQAKYTAAEKRAAAVLKKYKWFISPNIPIPLVFKVQELDKESDRQDKTVNAIFIKYFEANDWQALEEMAAEWGNSPYFKNRHKIITDCVLTVKNGSKAGINVSNVVLPTLIVQIDGILNDYMDDKGLNHIGYNTRKATLQANPLPVPLSTELKNVASEVFLNILFQRSQTGTPLATPFNFNRHKILHAENTAYGRKDYLIRAFMVLDLLASLR